MNQDYSLLWLVALFCCHTFLFLHYIPLCVPSFHFHKTLNTVEKNINNWPLIVWNSDLLSVTKTSIDLMSIWRHLHEMFSHSFGYIEVSSAFEVCAPNEFYLTPISNFPLRAGTRITACCGLWFVSTVTFSSSSTALYGSFFFPTPA